MSSPEVCVICLNGITNNIFVPLTESAKIFNNSLNFLHSALTADIQLEFSNQNQLLLCKSCFDSALHLIHLSDQLAALQKEITDLTVAFSLSVLYRRTQAEILKNDTKKTKTPFPSSKQMIELNVTGLSQLFSIHPLQIDLLNNPEKNYIENIRPNTFALENTDIYVETNCKSFKNKNVKQEHSRHTNDTSILESSDCDEETVTDNMFINADEEEHLIEHYVESDVQNLDLRQPFDVSDPLSLARNENKIVATARKKIRPVKKIDVKMEVIAKTEGSDLLNSTKRPTIQLKKLRVNSKHGKTITNILSSRHLSSSSKSQSSSKRSKKPNRKASKSIKPGHRITNFLCEYCSKYFKNNSLLKVHLRIHTGEKPYQCSFCEKSFNQIPHLRYHERLHTGEKPFKCLYCDRRFVTTTNRTSHQRRHTGERPFKCDYCDKTFSETSNRNRHMKVHR